VYVVPLIPQVPDGSLCDICQNSLAHDPSCPVEDRVAEAVRGEELPPGVGVERVHVVHHAPLLVEAPETVWLEGCGETRALNVNSRTQILGTEETPRGHQLCRTIEWAARIIIGGCR